MYVTFQTMADSNQEEENEEHFAIHRNELRRKDCTDDFFLLLLPKVGWRHWKLGNSESTETRRRNSILE